MARIYWKMQFKLSVHTRYCLNGVNPIKTISQASIAQVISNTNCYYEKTKQSIEIVFVL